MSHYLRIALSRWSASLALASMLAISVFGLTSSPIFAAACTLTGTPLDASTSAENCDMSVLAVVNAGILSLNNDPAATVSGSPFTLSGTTIAGTFSFTSIVKDHLGNTTGWNLAASSTGLTNGGTTVDLNLTSEDRTTGASSCTNGTCPATAFIAVSPLTGAPQTFLHAGDTGHTVVVDGDYTNVTDGTFSIPAGSPAGNYSGTINIVLTNTF